MGSPLALVVKNLPANAEMNRCGLDPWVRKILWSKKWQPTPVSLSGKFHEKRKEPYSPWGHKESDMTEAAEHTSAFIHQVRSDQSLSRVRLFATP